MAEVYDRMTKQHEKINDLLGEALSETDREELGSLLDRLSDELDMHIELEEEFLYTPLEDIEEARTLIREGYEEHERIRQEVEELYEGTVGSSQWKAKLRALQELLVAHLAAEENTAVPLAYRLIPPEELDALGTRMVAELSRK
jgi:hemerythrin